MGKKLEILKQKQMGIALVALGVFLALFIFIFLYYKIIRITGFPEILPSKETVAYIEFPTVFDDADSLTQKLNKTLKIDWNKEIAPFAGERAAVVFLKGSSPNKLLPFALIQVRSLEQAFAYVKSFHNQTKEIKEKHISAITTFETPAVNFAFLSDVLVLAPSSEALATFLSSGLSQTLGSDAQFIATKQHLAGQYFAYIRPKEVPRSALSLIGSAIPQMPIMTFSLPSLGLAANKNGAAWQGESYAAFEKNLAAETAPLPYRALLLPFIPPDFELMIAGQNLHSQIKKIDALLASNFTFPTLSELVSRTTKEYLPDLKKEVAPLLISEFALTIKGSKVLFVAEVDEKTAQASIQKIHDSFKKNAGRFAPKVIDVTLPDKTKAQELVPDPSQIEPFEEKFQHLTIKGFSLGKKRGVYDAVVQGKWFISNDLTLLEKAILLTQEPGAQLRDSKLYKDSLQPILKNPELLGISVLPAGIFSFSKRTYADHMEANFVFQHVPGVSVQE